MADFAAFFSAISQYYWLLLTTGAALLWAINNNIDKGLLSHFFKDDGGVGGLIIVSALLSILAAPVIWAFDHTVIDVVVAPPSEVLGFLSQKLADGSSISAPAASPTPAGVGFYLIVTTSALDVLVLWCYLKAIQKDEPSQVIIYYQLVPVIGVLAGWILLRETVSSGQLASMAVILAGTTLMSFGIMHGRFTFRWRTFAFMVPAATAWAFELAIFKVAALEESLWYAVFWKHIVLALIGAVMFLMIPGYRRSFLFVMRSNSSKVLGLNLTNEVLYMLGTIATAVAVMPKQVGIVLVPETFQSIFVFLIALAIARYAPQYATESFSREHTLKKVIAIGTTVLGTFLLVLTS